MPDLVVTGEAGRDNVLTPSEAVKLVSGYVASSFEARQIIADGFHSGALTAYAFKVMSKDEFDPTEEWDALQAGAELIGQDTWLETSTFKMSTTWPQEMRFWDWDRGHLIVCASDDPAALYGGCLLEGVRVSENEVLKLIGRSDRTGAGGPKPDLSRWAAFFAQFMLDCTHDRIDWDTVFHNPNQVREAMRYSSWRVDGKPFSPGALEVAVEAVWNGVVQEQCGERRSKRD